jgi:hypothetical protein
MPLLFILQNLTLALFILYSRRQMTFPLREESTCESVCSRMPLCDAFDFQAGRCEIEILCPHVKEAIVAVSGASITSPRPLDWK